MGDPDHPSESADLSIYNISQLMGPNRLRIPKLRWTGRQGSFDWAARISQLHHLNPLSGSAFANGCLGIVGLRSFVSSFPILFSSLV